MHPCPACGLALESFGTAIVLGRHQAHFDRCSGCGLVAARDPHWLDEAYESAITALDIGLLQRCRDLALLTRGVLRTEGLAGGRVLDWGGGYGTLTRLLRDAGIDCWHHDPLCKNVFAEDFEGTPEQPYDAICAFEVLEHLTDPLPVLQTLSASADLVLLSTVTLPEPTPAPTQWWYYALETGQHITLHTRSSLQHLAHACGMTCTSVSDSFHVLHRGPLRLTTRVALRGIAPLALAGLVDVGVRRRRGSLLAADLETARGRSRD